MPMIRCNNGHYYDSEKHSDCPYCGVKDINFGKTQALKQEPDSLKKEEGKTIGIQHKKMGIDPVVGWIVCIEGVNKGKDFRLHSEKNFIGRSETMDICIKGDETISRENHAILSYNPKNNSFKIYTGESRGLVYLNNEEVDIPALLKPYDVIEIGEAKLLFIPLCSEKFLWDNK